MKKKMLLLLPMAIALSGCTWWNPLTWFKKEEEKPAEPDDVTPDEMKQHAKSMSASPSKPFFLKVGEEKKVSVSLDPTPTDEYERKFTWKLTGDSVSYSLDEEKGKSATIVGLKEGTSYLKVTNTYNTELTKTFTIKVIDFDPENQYFWQFDKDVDKPQFEGLKNGIANLSGIEWDFARAKSDYVQSLNGGIGFGKGEQPETDLKLTAFNSRPISSISIEASSANSLAKMSVKIGETTVMDQVTVSKVDYDKNMQFYTFEAASPLSGNVEIHVETDDLNPNPPDPETYKAPGAFSLKSIFITYGDELVFETEAAFNFKEMYEDSSSELYKDNLNKGSGKNFTFSDGSVQITLNNVVKEADDAKTPGYAHLNGDIMITAGAGEVIKKIEFKVPVAEDSAPANKYVVETTRSGGAPYSSSGVTCDKNGLLEFYVYGDNVSTVRLKSKSNYVGIDYLNVKTMLGDHGVISGLETPEVYAPTKVEYYAGEYFDTTGLPVARIAYTDSSIQKDMVKPSDMEWYDGPSYDANPATAKKVLAGGTTYVYGVLRAGLTVKITGLTVISEDVNITLVKDISEINTSSHYYLLVKNSDPAKQGLILSTADGNMGQKNKGGVNVLEGVTIEDEMSISKGFENDYYSFIEDGGLKQIAGVHGNYFSMTNSGGISYSANPQGQKSFTLSINETTGVASFYYEVAATSKTGYLYYTGTNVTIGTDGTKSNLLIYKVA